MRVALSIFAFVLGLLASAEVLRAWTEPKASTSGGAIEYLAAKGKDIDVVVVGSSTVRLHFITARFDEEMAKRGYEVSSFAFSQKGLQGAELDYYLEEIVQLGLPKLKWVLVDISLDQFRPLEEDNWYKRRVIEWHAPDQVAMLMRMIATSRKDLSAKVEQAWPHLAHGFLRYANVGAGVEAATNNTLLRKRKPESIRPATAFSVGPYVEKKQVPKYTSYITTQRKRHISAVGALRKSRKLRKSARGYLRSNEYAVTYRDRIEGHGLKAAFILAPMLTDVRMVTDVKGGSPLRFLDFNDPDRYPELYDVERRYDRVHLHWSGAQIFTTLLADRFVDLLAAERDERMKIAAGEQD